MNHHYPNERIDHSSRLHWTGRDQNWNYQCAEYHSTNLEKHYDLAKDSFHTMKDRLTTITGLVLLLAASWLMLASVAAAEDGRHVLVLYSNHRLLPANVEADAGLRETISPDTELSAEFLDYPRFSGESYLRTLTAFLRTKYALRPPAAIIVGGEEALALLLQYRAQLFPEIPVVHMGVMRAFLRDHPPLPADVIGVPIELDFSATIEQALRWHPRASHLVLITGAAVPDHAFEAQLRRDVGRFSGRVTTEFLAGLPTATLQQRLGELGDDAIVFTPGYFEDGAGDHFIPRAAAKLIATAATVPVYAPFDPFLGTGIVGGAMTPFLDMGRQAGQLVNALLDGAAPASLTVPTVMPLRWHLDWRQVRRWGIDARAIPEDAVIHFRTPTFFEQYRRESLLVLSMFVLQSGMILWFLAERRRRRRAELTLQKQRFELVHASRLAVAGELTASIAHEINQPLGAILSNADAADLMLESSPASSQAQREELRAILADIRRDDLRASAVIQRLRGLFAKQAVEHQPFDLNDVVRDTESLLRIEARRRRVSLDTQPAARTARLLGDRIQIQQVLINLVLNAMDALAQQPEERRTVVVSVAVTADVMTLRVVDGGLGIAFEHLPQLSDSFFSTKRQGMGLGLSIARTLVEAHGGRIRAENAPGLGAVFQVEFPVVGGSQSTWETV
ncbi:ATP-binding protein [uncultured Thiocystis sp.]|jgi:signal transduction histidine kinase|uniref:sensor histidine kinase n=1 Tax=uncultured Thiocystis sp. TaxID=1202134 RepID=UPI0025F63AB0|nr:ATP-binding protein [uncultured Thiocystis sp.]